MERQRKAIHAAGHLQLTEQRLRIDTDTHRGELQRRVEHSVPNQDVAIEAAETVRRGSGPIIVVRGAAIVTRAVGEGAADAANEDGAVATRGLSLTLLGAEIGELRAKLLGVHKGDLAGQRGRDVREGLMRHGLGGQQGAVDAADDVVKEVHRAILRADGALPVPLVDVERVDVV